MGDLTAALKRKLLKTISEETEVCINDTFLYIFFFIFSVIYIDVNWFKFRKINFAIEFTLSSKAFSFVSQLDVKIEMF